MLRALRVVSVERGHDPRDFALVAYGGAGPLHACSLAEELGIRTVLVPASAGVLSALGLVASDERRDRVESRLVPLDEAGELPRDGEADLRYAGQSFELTIPLQPDLAARVPPRARRPLRLRRPRRARSSSSRFAPPTFGRARRFELPRAEPLTVRARPCSSSPAPPALFPRGGWGLGMGRTLKVTKP